MRDGWAADVGLGKEGGTDKLTVMKLFDALGCLFLACLVGLLFMTLGMNGHAYTWPVWLSLFYGLTLLCSFPFWLCTFAPLYLITGARSFFWRWYVAPIVGAIIGYVSGLILFAPTQYEFYDFPNQYLTPPVIGFVTFLSGSLLKKLSLSHLPA